MKPKKKPSERQGRRPEALIVTPHPGGNFHVKCLELARNNPGLLRPGKLVRFIVVHDSWCALQEGRPCDCNCEVKFAIDQTRN
jgi:hypothetical protein